MNVPTWSGVVALPVSPHKLDNTSGFYLRGGSDGDVVIAILCNVARNGFGLDNAC